MKEPPINYWGKIEAAKTHDELVKLVLEVQEALVRITTTGFSEKAKVIRNDIAKVCCTLADRADLHEAMVGNSLLAAAFTYSCAPELGLPEAKKYPFMCRIEAADLEFKRLLWDFLNKLAFYEPAARFLLQNGLMRALTPYLDKTNTTEAVLRWTKAGLLVLQHQALALISTLPIYVFSPQYFDEALCGRRMLQFLQDCPDSSLHEECIQTLFFIANSVNRYSLIEHGVIQAALKLIANVPDIDIKRCCFGIVSGVCAEDDLGGPVEKTQRARELFREYGGAEIVCSLLQHDIYNQPKLQDLCTSIIECIWNGVIGVSATESAFLANNGVHLMLNCLDRGSFATQQPVLSCLIDLFDSAEQEVKPIALKWRSVGPDWGPLQQILVRLWMKKEYQESPQSLLKLFLLCSYIGFEPHELLSFDEKISLVDMSQHAEETVDAAWEDLETTLHKNGVRPIGPDRSEIESHRMQREARRTTAEECKRKYEAEKADATRNEDAKFYKSLIVYSGDITDKSVTTDKNAGKLTITQAKKRKTEMLKESFRSAFVESQQNALRFVIEASQSMPTAPVKSHVPFRRNFHHPPASAPPYRKNGHPIEAATTPPASAAAPNRLHRPRSLPPLPV